MATDRELINQLLTRAGMIMEDASVLAIVDDGLEPVATRIAAVRRAAREVTALADAAYVLADCG